jgi:flagellar export protein FliJ
MAPFRFSLQALLDRRANLEAEQRRALLAAEDVAARENAKLATLAARLQQSSRSFSGAWADTAAGDVRALLLEIELVKNALARQQHAADAACREAAVIREAFLAACTERKQLEGVRDRSHAAFLAGQERREAADHDEANARRGLISP